MTKRRQSKPGRKRGVKDLAGPRDAKITGGVADKLVTSDRPEDAAFYYNRIAFSYAATTDGK